VTRASTPARVVLGVVLLLLLAAWTSILFNTNIVFRAKSGGTYEVTAIFDQVAGATKGTEVRAGGKVVGRVEDIALKGRDLRPYVTLRIDRDLRLRQGAMLDLRLYSNAGQLNRYIDVEQGTGPALPDGATVGLALTDQPVEFDEVLRTLDGPTRKDVAQVIDALQKSTDGRGADYERTAAIGTQGLGETARLLAELSSDGAALRTAVQQGDRVVSAVAKDPASLGAFADQLGGLLATTATRQQQLAEAVKGAGPALREPRAALERLDTAIPELRRLVASARPAARALKPFADDLRPALAAARPTLRSARTLTANGPADLRRLSGVLRTANPLLPALTKTLCQAGPILDEARATTPDVFGAVQLFGAITSNYDANGHAARIFAHVPRITGGVIEPNENRFGLLAKPWLRVPGVNIGQPWNDYRSSFIGGDGSC
jgi:ABC-type transporter Mla subunit MlaD